MFFERSGHNMGRYISPFAHHFNVYLTLLSIFQIMTFGEIAHAFITVRNAEIGSYVFEYMLAILFVTVVWHKYVNHHQFAGRQFSYRDTLIIIAFGLVECYMLVAFYKEREVEIHVAIALAMILGIIAYRHSLSELSQPNTQQGYEEQFLESGNGRWVYHILLGFEQVNIDMSIKAGGVLTITAMIALIVPSLRPYLSVYSTVLLIYYLQKWEMRDCFTVRYGEMLRGKGQEFLGKIRAIDQPLYVDTISSQLFTEIVIEGRMLEMNTIEYDVVEHQVTDDNTTGMMIVGYYDADEVV